LIERVKVWSLIEDRLGAGMRLSLWMTKSPEMQQLWDEMTVLIIM